jgi:predicted DNA repair protein MutK
MARHQQHATHIAVEHPCDVICIHFAKRASFKHAGIVDQDVDTTMALGCTAHRALPVPG